MLRFVDLFFVALLVYVAWLQLNDPDPLFWSSLYLISAAAPLLHFLNKPIPGHLYILGIAAGFCLAGIAMVFSGASNYLDHLDESLIQDMSPSKPYIEESRELLGTLIALAIIAVYSWLARKK